MLDATAPIGPDEERDSASIGVVEAVSPNKIEVSIFREAPHGTGLREGTLHRFPRINGYIVLPSERGGILAVVTWVGVEADRLDAVRQEDRIGLAAPRRRLYALPLGVLTRTASLLDGGEPAMRLDRGVLVFPTVGDPVRLPTRAEALTAVPGELDNKLTVPIGRAPLANDAEVRLDPNRLFGRHLAILGNTGSGKSCTVAHLLRTTASAALEGTTGFRAIVLDPNGEYAKAFDDLRSENVPVRRFSVLPRNPNSEQFRVPYWLWNYREWLSFTDASAKSQAPQLRRCLHLLRTTNLAPYPGVVVALVAGRQIVRQYEARAVAQKEHVGCLSILDTVIADCRRFEQDPVEGSAQPVADIRIALDNTLKTRRGSSSDFPWKLGAGQLNQEECANLVSLFNAAITALGVPQFLDDGGVTVDAPAPFDARTLLGLLPLMAADAGVDVGSWVAPLVDRLRIALADDRLNSISGWQAGETLEDWLKTYLVDGATSQISVIDLSLVPSQVLHVVVAVFARLLLESLERHRRREDAKQIPTLLVLEEAHTLVREHVGFVGEDQAVPAARLCREAFERIAREGRKFGLSLVVSSQRPSELSETVLFQCNTFLIHRIVNDHDQNLVRRLVPDNLRSLTEELPALPTQTALVVGWALEIPCLVRIADLAKKHRPNSPDPDFATAWTSAAANGANWSAVASDWTAPDEQANSEHQQAPS